MSLGSAAITSSFVSPFNTGMRNRTSDTLERYKSRTLATNSALGGTGIENIDMVIFLVEN